MQICETMFAIILSLPPPFTMASKIICDDTSSNKSWSIVALEMPDLREIDQMEREMCSHLNCKSTVDPSVLADFEGPVKRDIKGPGPDRDLAYALQMVSTTASSLSIPPSNPSFPQRHPSPHISSSSTDRTASTAVVIPKGSYTALPDRYAAHILIQAR